MAYLCTRTQEYRQHQNKTTSRTQSFTSVEVFLMLRSASLIWGRRRQKLMNFYFVTIWCQMSNSLKSWRLPVFVPIRDKELWKGRLSSCSETPPFLCHPNPLDVVLCWSWYAPDRYMWCLCEAPGHSDTTVHIDQAVMSIHTKLLNKEHVIESLSRESQVPWLPEDPYPTEVRQMSLKTWSLRSSSFLMSVGSNTSSFVVPWTSIEPCVQ